MTACILKIQDVSLQTKLVIKLVKTNKSFLKTVFTSQSLKTKPVQIKFLFDLHYSLCTSLAETSLDLSPEHDKQYQMSQVSHTVLRCHRSQQLSSENSQTGYSTGPSHQLLGKQQFLVITVMSKEYLSTATRHKFLQYSNLINKD